jgi:hypothetical protein
MSGGNGIPRYAQWNRENELAPLRFRGITFRTLDPLSVVAPLTLTPDQVMNNLNVTGAGGQITWPTVAALLANPSQFGLLSKYSVAPGAQFDTNVTNFSAGNVTLSFPGGGATYIVSPTLSLTLAPNESRTIRYRVISPTQIYVY